MTARDKFEKAEAANRAERFDEARRLGRGPLGRSLSKTLEPDNTADLSPRTQRLPEGERHTIFLIVPSNLGVQTCARMKMKGVGPRQGKSRGPTARPGR